MSKFWDAVVLGLDINGLGVVRSLGKMNLRILGIYQSKDEFGRFSKYCKAIMIKRDSLFSQKLVDVLLKIASVSNRPFLLATSDLYIKIINENREALERRYRFVLPDKNLVEAILSKRKEIKLAEEHGLAIPNTYRFSSLDDFFQQSSNINFPCILKPDDSFRAIFPESRKNFVFNDYDAMLEFLRKYPNVFEDALLQEIIPGGDKVVSYCMMYLDENSTPIGVFSAKKIRQFKPDFGITCFAESCTLAEIIDTSKRFLKEIQFQGLIGIEFMKDKRDGKYKFIEMNPRTHWANSHALYCGVNLPFIAYADAVGARQLNKACRIQKDGVRWIYFRRDLQSFILKRKSGEIDTIEWIMSLLAARCFGCFDHTDPMPFLFDMFDLFWRVCTKPVRLLLSS